MKADKPLDPEKVFRALLRRECIAQPIAEFRFAAPRRWKFDYAWPDYGVALEVEGGVWTRGRHTRGAGFLKDCEKYNAAAIRGWLVLRTVPSMLSTLETMVMLRSVIAFKLKISA